MAAGLLFACACSAACGESTGGYFTGKEDLYYHLLENCGGTGERVPISLTAAQAFLKAPCPVCIPTECAQEPRAAVRGGTLVVAIADTFLEQQEMAGVFNWQSQSPVEGAAAVETLSEYLNGDQYLELMADYRDAGAAQGLARIPEWVCQEGETLLSRRHLGGMWYLALRTGTEPGERWTLDLQIRGIGLHYEQDALYNNFEFQTQPERLQLELERAREETVFQKTQGTLSVEVYRELDMNIAVFYDQAKNAPEDAVRLYIGGRMPGIALSGYQDGDFWVSCCVLSDAELEALKRGDSMELQKVE